MLSTQIRLVAIIATAIPAAATAQTAPAGSGEPASASWLIERSEAAAAFPRSDPILVAATAQAIGDTIRPSSLDLRVASHVRSAGLQRSGVMRVTARLFDTAAIPGTLLLASALYGAGHLQDDPALSDLGLHTGQAIVAAGALSLAGKVLVGRARPRISPDDPHDLALGRGLEGNRYQSFPSAHTALAFATAAVIASDIPDRMSGASAWVAPVAYGGAVLSGVSRLYFDEHWATDILAGAVIGTLMGIGFAN